MVLKTKTEKLNHRPNVKGGTTKLFANRNNYATHTHAQRRREWEREREYAGYLLTNWRIEIFCFGVGSDVKCLLQYTKLKGVGKKCLKSVNGKWWLKKEMFQGTIYMD